MIVFSEAYLHGNWAREERIRLRGKSYRVGRMSYGNWFLEPGVNRGEKSDFNSGTLWPVRIPNTDNYKV